MEAATLVRPSCRQHAFCNSCQLAMRRYSQQRGCVALHIASRWILPTKPQAANLPASTTLTEAAPQRTTVRWHVAVSIFVAANEQAPSCCRRVLTVHLPLAGLRTHTGPHRDTCTRPLHAPTAKLSLPLHLPGVAALRIWLAHRSEREHSRSQQNQACTPIRRQSTPASCLCQYAHHVDCVITQLASMLSTSAMIAAARRCQL